MLVTRIPNMSGKYFLESYRDGAFNFQSFTGRPPIFKFFNIDLMEVGLEAYSSDSNRPKTSFRMIAFIDYRRLSIFSFSLSGF